LERWQNQLGYATLDQGDSMKVGDLVSLKMKKTQPPQEPQRAIVLDVFIDQDGFEKIKVAWQNSVAIGNMANSRLFEVISESR
jgi:hypothetical protein